MALDLGSVIDLSNYGEAVNAKLPKACRSHKVSSAQSRAPGAGMLATHAVARLLSLARTVPAQR